MRPITATFAALLLLATIAPALANGTLRAQESNGTVRVYHNVSIKVVHRTLRISSHDGKGTLVVNQAACSYVGVIERCFPERVSLEQGGSTRLIDLKNGTIYVNPTDETQQLPLSSQHIPRHGVVLEFNTQRGTYVSMTGTIDGLVR